MDAFFARTDFVIALMIIVICYTALIVLITGLVSWLRHEHTSRDIIETYTGRMRELDKKLYETQKDNEKEWRDLRVEFFIPVNQLLSDPRKNAFIKGIFARMESGVHPAFEDWRLIRNILNVIFSNNLISSHSGDDYLRQRWEELNNTNKKTYEKLFDSTD